MKENEVPTIKVKSEDSFATINESDYDSRIHELIDEDDSKVNKPSLEQNKTKSSSGQGSSGKRGGARGRNKKDNAAGDKAEPTGGQDLPEKSADGSGE